MHSPRSLAYTILVTSSADENHHDHGFQQTVCQWQRDAQSLNEHLPLADWITCSLSGLENRCIHLIYLIVRLSFACSERKLNNLFTVRRLLLLFIWNEDSKNKKFIRNATIFEFKSAIICHVCETTHTNYEREAKNRERFFFALIHAFNESVANVLTQQAPHTPDTFRMFSVTDREKPLFQTLLTYFVSETIFAVVNETGDTKAVSFRIVISPGYWVYWPAKS